tara:strand:+ start:314 stop:985 length:672 start_codon:yes stop_codon:yes gene_type:complete
MAGIPINFVCLKWGTKYSADFVNKLYGMCSRNFKGFDFHCMTEDPTDIRSEVNIIPLPEDDLERWWWKMWLFNEEWMTLDNGVFLDLDLIIQKPFKPAFANNMSLLYTDWIDVKQMHKDILGDRYKYCDLNSSIMSWNIDTKRNNIWEEFSEYKERIISLFRGIDNYLCNRHSININHYPNNIAHSYWTTNRTWKDVPVILFDYEDDKQDKVDEEWIHTQWIK